MEETEEAKTWAPQRLSLHYELGNICSNRPARTKALQRRVQSICGCYSSAAQSIRQQKMFKRNMQRTVFLLHPSLRTRELSHEELVRACSAAEALLCCTKNHRQCDFGTMICRTGADDAARAPRQQQYVGVFCLQQIILHEEEYNKVKALLGDNQ